MDCIKSKYTKSYMQECLYVPYINDFVSPIFKQLLYTMQ